MKKTIVTVRNERLTMQCKDSAMEISDDNDENEDVECISEKVHAKDNNIITRILKARFKLIITILILVVGVAILKFFKQNSTPVTIYEERFNQMKSSFPDQSQISWKMLNHSLTRQINQNSSPEKPSVLIFVGQKERIETFQKSLLHVIAGSGLGEDCPTYEMTNISNDMDSLMEDMYGFLANQRQKGFRCTFWPSIDNIPPTLGIPLHGLTDELNAKYKDELYIFSFYVAGSGTSLAHRSDKEAEGILLDKLRSVWESSMGVERFAAVTTRLCVNVMAVM